jgi:hypothetical protein
MAAIDALSARAKLAVLEALIRGAEGSPHVTWSASARATIDLLRGEMPQDAGGAADAHWDALPEEQRAEICRKLDSLEQQLKIQTAPKGWSGPRPMMSPDPTPSWIVMLLLILAVFGTAGVLLTIVQRWDRATQGDGSSSQAQSAFALAKSLAEEASKEFEKQRAAQDKAVAELEARKGDPADEVAKLTQTVEAARRDTLAADALAGRRWVEAITAEGRLGPRGRHVLIMVILLGALGGFIHLASSLTMFVGNRDLKQSWTVYYLLTPIQGAAIAPLIYLLLKSAVLSPQLQESGTSNLNLTAIYAMAGLSGLFAKQAIEKLADVFATLFAKVKGKDETKGGAGKTT